MSCAVYTLVTYSGIPLVARTYKSKLKWPNWNAQNALKRNASLGWGNKSNQHLYSKSDLQIKTYENLSKMGLAPVTQHKNELQMATTTSYCYAVEVQAGKPNGDHHIPELWDVRQTVLNTGLQSAKSCNQRDPWRDGQVSVRRRYFVSSSISDAEVRTANIRNMEGPCYVGCVKCLQRAQNTLIWLFGCLEVLLCYCFLK